MGRIIEPGKGLDTVLHDDVFDALADSPDIVPEDVQCFLLLYSDMTAYVKLDGGLHSRAFAITRGVRQGDL